MNIKKKLIDIFIKVIKSNETYFLFYRTGRGILLSLFVPHYYSYLKTLNEIKLKRKYGENNHNFKEDEE